MPNKSETQTPTMEAGEFTYDAHRDNNNSIVLRKWRDDRCVDTRYLQDGVSMDQFMGIIKEDERVALDDGYTIDDDHTQDAICDYFIDPSD